MQRASTFLQFYQISRFGVHAVSALTLPCVRSPLNTCASKFGKTAGPPNSYLYNYLHLVFARFFAMGHEIN